MKLKHWQGYGTVTATRTMKRADKSTGLTTMVIRVEGNHECGLERRDVYDVSQWLIRRFDKDFLGYKTVRSMTLDSDIVNGVDVCEYTVVYETPPKKATKN